MPVKVGRSIEFGSAEASGCPAHLACGGDTCESTASADLMRRIALWILALAMMTAQSTSQNANRESDVTPERLLRADSDGDEWLTAGRDSDQSYFSPLADINKGNVHQLGFAWAYDIGANSYFESTPIVVNGVMFASGMRGAVYAVDAKTGLERWRFVPSVITGACTGRPVNRGIAVSQGKVYVASLDGYLYALDARTGDLVWKVDTIVDRSRGYSSTGAPYIAKDYIVIGNAGAECDARGYVTAYDHATGKKVWRFFTVPGDPKLGFEHPELEMAAKTWSPNSLWEVGLGGTAWDGMAYDPKLNLLYVGTGNGTPWPRALRSPGGGDNLFLSSILAIDSNTGRLVWHYQTTPGDNWDYTATQKLILADLNIKGRIRQVIMQAPKNGFFYVLDRRSGELLSAAPYATVTWADHVDIKTGRPQETQQGDYSKEPKLIFPGSSGAHNWHPRAYNPKTGLVYIPARDIPTALTATEEAFKYHKGQWNAGVTFLSLTPSAEMNPERRRLIASLTMGQPDQRRSYFIKAWDPARQKLQWQIESQSWNGVMTTAGGLVFHGRKDGRLVARDADTGTQIHSIDLGQDMASAPMSYKVDDEQFIAIMADDAASTRDGFVIESAGQNGRILAFKLGGGEVPRQVSSLTQASKAGPPPIQRFGKSQQITLGQRLFERHCMVCHADGVRAPDLMGMNLETHTDFLRIVIDGQRADRGMASFNAVLSKSQAQAIHAYLTNLAWEQYRNRSSHSPVIEETAK